MNKQSAGRRGGRSKSLDKQDASRRNGASGGRPKRAEALLADIRNLYEKIRGKCQDIADEDLILIVERMCRKPGSGRRFFIRPLRDGGYGV